MSLSADKPALFFRWEPKYETGHEEVDSQHQQLFKLGNQLLSADFEAGKKLIMEFFTYVRIHFQAEEQFMVECNYEGYAEHKILHEDLLTTLSELAGNYFDNGAQYEEFKFFVYHWVTKHIMDEDMKIKTSI